MSGWRARIILGRDLNSPLDRRSSLPFYRISFKLAFKYAIRKDCCTRKYNLHRLHDHYCMVFTNPYVFRKLGKSNSLPVSSSVRIFCLQIHS